MPRLATPTLFHPSLQFRYMLISTKLPGVSIYARSAQQPSISNNPKMIHHKNGYFKMKGKSVWNDIQLLCYQFEGITSEEMWRYLNQNHQNIETATDKFADEYKHLMILTLLNPHKVPIGIWRLHGAFISDVAWGDLDWANDDVVQCSLTIAYDYAIHGFGEVDLGINLGGINI